jgi:hypothetical protein
MATKTLRVTLADILGAAGPAGRVHGEVWARFVDATGAPREVRYADGTVVTIARPRVALNASGVADFVVVPNDDPSVHPDDQGFGIQVGWDLKTRGASGTSELVTNRGRTVAITSASPTVAQYGLLAAYVPVIPGASYATEGSVSASYLSKVALNAQAFRGMKESLSGGTNSTGLGVLSDSTGVNTTRWPHRLWQLLATSYPAYTFVARHWNDTTQDFDAPITIQTGTAGARYMDMVAGNYPRRLRGVAHLTGVIDVRVNVYMADWTPGNSFGAEVLVGEGGGTGDWGWSFAVNSAGIPRLYYSTDGTTLASISANAVSGITDGSTSWVRCVFNPNDGAGNRVAKFYKSTDGIAWTQVGTTVTTAGAVTLSDRIAGGSTYLLGNQGAATNTSAVRIFEVDIRNGENGPSIGPRLPEHWAYYGANTSHAIVGAPIATLVNGAKTGANIAYLDEATRRKLLTPDYGQQVTILSDSHNELGVTGARWGNAYATWVSDVRALVGPALIAITQNPEIPGATGLYQTEHARRRLDLLGFAKSLGLDVIDTYKVFTDYGAAWTTDLMGDNVHPNAAGSDLQRDVIKAAFDRA